MEALPAVPWPTTNAMAEVAMAAMMTTGFLRFSVGLPSLCLAESLAALLAVAMQRVFDDVK